MVMFSFLTLDQEYPFWVNLVEKIGIVFSSQSFGSKLIEYSEFNGEVKFFSFTLEIPFLEKFVTKSQNLLFKVKT